MEGFLLHRQRIPVPLERFRLQQRAAFQQTAKIFLARLVMGACGGLETLEGFVTDFQPFQAHDADESVAVFPDLALPEFQRQGDWYEGRNAVSPEKTSARDGRRPALLLLGSGLFLGNGLLDYDFFLRGFGFSSHNFFVFSSVDLPVEY